MAARASWARNRPHLLPSERTYVGGNNPREALMTFPQRVLLSRQGSNVRVPGMVAALPHEGESLQMFLENGRVMRTSPVTHIEQDGTELVVDTQNSRYH